jgi:hypothetical protein
MDKQNVSQRAVKRVSPFGAIHGAAGIGALGLVLTFGAALPSGAAGNAGLSKYIISNPQHGWAQLSKSQLNSFVSGVNKSIGSSVSASDGSVITAANGWQKPGGTNFLLVTLLAVSVKGASASQTATQARDSAGAAAVSFCSGASNGNPQSNVALPSIAGSHDAICPAESNGAVPRVITWSKGNVIAMLVTVSGAVPDQKLASIAQAQFKKMRSAGFTVGG